MKVCLLTLSEEHRLRVCGNRVQRRIFGPKRKEVAGSWRRLYNEKLHNFYASPNIIRAIKSRRVRWVGHVACMGYRYIYICMRNILVVKPENLEDLGTDDRIILK
jgi:hypothetical protein